MKINKVFLIIGLFIIVCIFVLVLKSEIFHNNGPNRASEEPNTHIGIDVSHHQGDINWVKVANQTDYIIDFVYIKATEGNSFVDPLFKTNVEVAKAVGFKVGAYHFFRLSSSVEEQFENFKNNVPCDFIDLIPMIDVELDNDWKKYPNLSITDIHNRLNEFIKLIEAYYGCKPMIYGTMRSYNTYCAPTFNNYNLYIGRYGTKKPIIKGKGTYTIWQYSETGHLPGIEGTVDLSKFNEKYTIEDIILK